MCNGAANTDRDLRMDDARFDDMARGLDSRLTRRHAGGLATGALLALGLAMESDAKKKKKKKRKKSKKKTKGGSNSCSNLGAICGSTAAGECQCRLDKNNKQVCLANPFELGFLRCESQADCPKGAFCDDGSSTCANGC